MAFRFKLGSSSLVKLNRHFSTSILNPNSKTPLTSKEKSRAALSLLRVEKNPERILEICRAAELTPESRLDRIAYSKAVFRLKDLNYLNGIRDFIEESKARPDLKSERFMSHFIVLYGQAGLVREAVKTFEEMLDRGIERNAKTLNSLLFACRLAKDYEEMKRVFVEFPKLYEINPDINVYNTMINGLCESNQTSSVYSILADMESKGIKPNAATFGSMIAGFYKDKKFDDVGKVLEMMGERGITQSISTYNIRILSLCKLGRSKEAKALYTGLIERGIKPNTITYTHLIHGFCKEKDFGEAVALFDKMTQSGITPLSECYFTLLHYLCGAKEFEAALRICKQCMSKEGWVPNFTTMKSLVQGLTSISKIDEAKEIINELKEKFSSHSDRWAEIEEGLAA